MPVQLYHLLADRVHDQSTLGSATTARGIPRMKGGALDRQSMPELHFRGILPTDLETSSIGLDQSEDQIPIQVKVHIV